MGQFPKKNLFLSKLKLFPYFQITIEPATFTVSLFEVDALSCILFSIIFMFEECKTIAVLIQDSSVFS